MGWSLAIDFGTTATTAAIHRDDTTELVQFRDSTRLPSGVFVHDDATLLVGTTAANMAGADPSRYVRTPKRHLGIDDAVVVAGAEVSVVELVAAVLRSVASQAVEWAGGDPPDLAVLTHPARWARRRVQALVRAAGLVGIDSVVAVPEPVAAGHGTLGAHLTDNVAVYDLGGGTFDAAVLDGADGAWRLAGRPGGVDSMGGEAFDALLHRRLVEHLAARSADAAQAIDSPSTAGERGLARTWWRDLRTTKEVLSEVSSTQIAVPGTDDVLLITRDEVEELVGPSVTASVDAFERTILESGVGTVSLRCIVLCGDASRMPIVARLVSERFPEVTMRYADDPKGVVVRGAVAAVVATGMTSSAPPASPAPAAGPAAPALGRSGPVPQTADPRRAAVGATTNVAYRPALWIHVVGLIRQVSAILGRSVVWNTADAARFGAWGPDDSEVWVYYVPLQVDAYDPADHDPVRLAASILGDAVAAAEALEAFGGPATIVDTIDDGVPATQVISCGPGHTLVHGMRGEDAISRCVGQLRQLADMQLAPPHECLCVPTAPNGPDTWLRVPEGYRIEETLTVDLEVDGSLALTLRATTRSDLVGQSLEAATATARGRSVPAHAEDGRRMDLLHRGPAAVAAADCSTAECELYSDGRISLLFTVIEVSGRPVVVEVALPGGTRKGRFGSPPRSWGPLTSLLYYLGSTT